MNGGFPMLQAMYAQHRIATYPLTVEKTPAVRSYGRVGSPYSARLALKFSDATAAGFCAGPRNRLTIIDIDSTDDRLVEEIQQRYGVTPLQVMTPSGGRHLYYRHGGEPRRIKPLPDIDILGAGNVVAALSVVPKGHYTIERGSLDDLDRLPKLCSEAPRHGAATIQRGQRNLALFNHCRAVVDHCDTLDQLIDVAQSWADNRLAEPLPAVEIIKTCNSVWTYRDGRKRVVNHIVEAPVYAKLLQNRDAMFLFAVLSAENGIAADFMVADGLGSSRGWPRRLVPEARKALLGLGIIKCVRPHGPQTPALYRWTVPS